MSLLLRVLGAVEVLLGLLLGVGLLLMLGFDSHGEDYGAAAGVLVAGLGLAGLAGSALMFWLEQRLEQAASRPGGEDHTA